MPVIAHPRDVVGRELGPSEWFEVTQERIDAFADVTGDHQWIHVDRERASTSPYGTTIAHGYLTLSLLAPLLDDVWLPPDEAVTINYGVNRVRFPAPVPSGSRIRARLLVASVADVPGGVQATLEATVELEGGDRPVCVAELLLRVLD